MTQQWFRESRPAKQPYTIKTAFAKCYNVTKLFGNCLQGLIMLKLLQGTVWIKRCSLVFVNVRADAETHFKPVMVLKTAFLRRPCFQVRDTLLIKTLCQTLT